MSVLLKMFLDLLPYYFISLIISPSVYLLEESYKINFKAVPFFALGASIGYRLFSYFPQIAIIAFIASSYAFSSMLLPRSSEGTRMVFSIVYASLFSLVLYLLAYLARDEVQKER